MHRSSKCFIVTMLRRIGLIFGFALLAVLYALLNHTNGRIISDGRRRRYLLYVPRSYTPSVPAPLVLSFHGFVEWPAHQQHISRWSELADEYGFIVVYPCGTGLPLRWRAFGSLSRRKGAGEDVAFIRDLIDKLSQEYAIDPARIYANGLSNGAGMTHMLACKLADRIAAIGGVAGAYMLPFSECQTARAVPVIAFHGDADPIVPYAGGPSTRFSAPFPHVEEWAAGWAVHNGIAAEPQLFQAAPHVTGRRYTAPDSAGEVVLYTVHGGGHTWPGGRPLPRIVTGPTSQEIDASRMMWEFYTRHPMPQSSEIHADGQDNQDRKT